MRAPWNTKSPRTFVNNNNNRRGEFNLRYRHHRKRADVRFPPSTPKRDISFYEETFTV